MNQKAVLAIVIVLVLVGAVFVYRNYSGKRAVSDQQMESDGAPPPPQAESPDAENANAAKTHTVSMNNNGFSPNQIEIKAGDTVTFKNDDSRNRWPASGMHPTHQICPGFDALKVVKPGESYSYTFTETKECPFHDHLIPSLFGKITVAQ